MSGQKAEVLNQDKCRSESIKVIKDRQIFYKAENVAGYCGTGQDVISKGFDEACRRPESAGNEDARQDRNIT